MESKEEILLKQGEKYQVNVSFDAAVTNQIIIQETEIKKTVNDSSDFPSTSAIMGKSFISTKSINSLKPENLDSPHITLEKFGGSGYYKLIEEGLTYHGKLIESARPIFTEEDIGKTFCGLFAHQNPLEPVDDEFFPGIIGSRYALIVNVFNANLIEVNFEFNRSSDKGYIFHDNSLAFNSAMNAIKFSATNTIELQDGKTYVIPEFEKAVISRDFYLISNQSSNLKIGREDYFQWAEKKKIKQSASLFDFGGQSVKIGIKNVNFLPPHRRVKGAQLFFTSLFQSIPNKDQASRIIVLNMNSTLELNNKDPRYNQIGFGFGFMYSSEPGNYVVGKNIVHRGPGFMDFKANFGGGLFAVFENVTTDFKNEEGFASPRIKVKGRLENNIFTITSGHTIYQILTYDFGVGNVSHLLHLGRFTFVIDGRKAIINASQIKLRPFATGQIRLRVRDSTSVYAKSIELHAGDELIHEGKTYRVVEKTRTYVTEWAEGDEDVKYAMCLILDTKLPISNGFLEFQINSIGHEINNGLEQDAYLIYKANYEFRTYENTKFEDPEVLSSDPVGHLSYNHKEITLWAKNFKHNGFYRQSLSNVGKSNGYTLINCEGFEGQFKPDEPVKNTGDIPALAGQLIQELSSKF